VLLKSTGVTRTSQSIAFGTLPNRTQGDAAFALTATATSGLPVSFRVMDGPAIISGNTVTLTGAGVVTIAAIQSGNNNFFAADLVCEALP
jgi:hypothetical protein